MMKRKQSIRLTNLMKTSNESSATLNSLGLTQQDIENKLKRSKSNNAFLVRAAKRSTVSHQNLNNEKHHL